MGNTVLRCAFKLLLFCDLFEKQNRKAFTLKKNYEKIYKIKSGETQNEI